MHILIASILGANLLLIATLFVWMKAVIARARSGSVAQAEAERFALLELASHQLGAPLATFRWWLELLGTPEGKELLQSDDVLAQIKEGVTRMDGIVTALRDADTIASNVLGFKRDVLASLKDVVQNVVEGHAAALRRRKIEVITQFEEDGQSFALDIRLIKNVLDELLQNAIDYSPDGKRIMILVVKKETCVQVDVADEGCGIPEAELSKIFGKFVRASNATAHKTVGNGLGLYISKGIVERAGGAMSIVSKEGTGTTVSFTLPFERVQTAAQPS
jgi:two-component system sensor histidine kinase VicK